MSEQQKPAERRPADLATVYRIWDLADTLPDPPGYVPEADLVAPEEVAS
jgi:hypothetical protein